MRYFRVLESDSIKGETQKDAQVTPYASSYGTVLNMIQGAQEEAKSSEAIDGRNNQRVTTDQRQMPDGTRKAVILWQGRSTLSVPTEQHRAGSANDFSTRQEEPGSGERWKCPACRGQHMYANGRGEIHLSSKVISL